MIYRVLHWISGIMLHWFYSEIRIDGREKIPATGPLLIAVNHPNAMVDSMVAGWVVPRRLRLTAKATLFTNPLVGQLFRLLGVVPLQRAADSAGSPRQTVERNREAFGEIIRALKCGESVLIFPEGRSNSDELMPLKTGLARIAIEARQKGVVGLSIVPIGLNFEDKGSPGSRVCARVGNPIDVDTWNNDSARAMTDLVGERLAVVSNGSGVESAPRRVAATRGLFVRAASWWGQTTHEIPVRYARALAVARSENADEPAMLTMLFGAGLIVASYAVHLLIVGILTRSLLWPAIYLATLVTGAYWTAFDGHRA